jgi:hypothetical protein
MKLFAALLAVASITLAASSADAKGCLKGAAVGGAAGHFAGHHGVIGAIAGCAYMATTRPRSRSGNSSSRPTLPRPPGRRRCKSSFRGAPTGREMRAR